MVLSLHLVLLTVAAAFLTYSCLLPRPRGLHTLLPLSLHDLQFTLLVSSSIPFVLRTTLATVPNVFKHHHFVELKAWKQCSVAVFEPHFPPLLPACLPFVCLKLPRQSAFTGSSLSTHLIIL